MESLLKPAGLEVTRAYTAAEARGVVARWSPDAIILDTQLPDLDGPELCAEFRDQGTLDPTVPIIITTAAPAGRAERARALGAGAWDFAPLPLDGELFLLRLETLLRARRASRDALLLDAVTGCCTETGLFVRGGAVAVAAKAQGLRLTCLRLGGSSDRSDFGRTVRSVGRRSDVFAVLEDGEYAVLAPVQTDEGAQVMANRLASAFKAGGPAAGETGQPVAAGYAIADPGVDRLGLRRLLQRAEEALRQARRAGSTDPVGAVDLPAA